MSDSVPARMVPPLDDDNSEFWTGGASGRLRIQYCCSCGRWVFPPTKTCPSCGSRPEYRDVSGRGAVFTHTVNYHPFNPDVPVPYSIAIVELVEQEGLRFMTNVVNCPPESVRIGMPVRVLFEQHGEVFVPLFEPNGDAGADPPAPALG